MALSWAGLVLLLAGCATPSDRGSGEVGGKPEAVEKSTQDDKPSAKGPEEESGAQAQGLGRGAAETAREEPLEPQRSGSGMDRGSPRPQKSRVFFAFDSSEIRKKAHKLLEKHAKYLKTHSGITVLLEGHADKRGSREYNLGLGERRAKSVRRVLELNGVASQRLEVVSYGEERPLREGNTEEAYAKNRRVRLRYRDTPEGAS